jgi:hypothetical protein
MWKASFDHLGNRVAYESGLRSADDYSQKRADIETDQMVSSNRKQSRQIVSETRKLQRLDKGQVRIINNKIQQLESVINKKKEVFKHQYTQETKGIRREPSSKALSDEIWIKTQELQRLRQQLGLSNSNIQFVDKSAQLRQHKLHTNISAHIGRRAIQGHDAQSQMKYEKELLEVDTYRSDIDEYLQDIFDDDESGNVEEENSKTKFITQLHIELLGESEISIPQPSRNVQHQSTESPISRKMEPDLSASLVNHAIPVQDADPLSDEYLFSRLRALRDV